jgi:hypothetical protein
MDSFPLIQEELEPLHPWSNAVLFPINASLESDVDWMKVKREARRIVDSGRSLLWEMDLGLERLTLTPTSSSLFSTLSFVIEQFVKEVLPALKEKTIGIILYRGTADFTSLFPYSAWEISYREWLMEKTGGFNLYSADLLADLMHRFISLLPDELLPYLMLDVRGQSSLSALAQLLSRERFEHIHFILKGSSLPLGEITWEEGKGTQASTERPPLGVCFPQDAYCTPEVMARLERVLEQLIHDRTAFRIIPEAKLTEMWDELDRLIVHPDALSTMGKRKVQGFLAAGGEVITAYEVPSTF